jgi:pimeloyl-ACP methyl ester carboxylesterase
MVGAVALGACTLAVTTTGPASGEDIPNVPSGVTWMTGYSAPGTPAAFDKVGVIKVGSPDASNVLVLEPGTSAAAAYFVPLARWIVANAPDWQVWAVQRRETLLSDESMLNLAKEGKATPAEVFNYYLGYLKDPSITKHFQGIPDSSVQFAKQWGMNVAVQDLHIVIGEAKRLGGKVVLGGHSLGGSVVTAYATWDFGGRPGADDLAGLVYIDGGSGPAESAQQASAALSSLNAPTTSPWLSFGGIPAPYAGIFSAAGSLAALLFPNEPSLGQSSGLLPPSIVPPVKVTNLGQYGYPLNVATSPPNLAAAQAHLGQGLASQPLPNGYFGWNSTGALTPIQRFATMFSGYPMLNVDGTEWYFPQRLTDDTRAVGNGIANPAQSVLGVNATMGSDLRHNLLMYAFGAALGGQSVLDSASQLAAQSGIPQSNLTLINEQSTYAHNDPAGAYPTNIFFNGLVPFLGKVAERGSENSQGQDSQGQDSQGQNSQG